MIQTNLGLVGIVSKGAYDEDVSYVKGNFVYYAGSSYLCISDDGATSITPGTNDQVWQILARGADMIHFTWGALANQ